MPEPISKADLQSLARARTQDNKLGRSRRITQTPLTEKDKRVLKVYLGGYCKDGPGSWQRIHGALKTYGQALYGWNKLIGKLAARRYIDEEIDSIISQAGLKHLRGLVVACLANTLLEEKKFAPKAGDKAKLASVLSRICQWENQVLQIDVPQLEIRITNAKETD